MPTNGRIVEINPRKDFDGNDLNIGDTVAFLAPHYRYLKKGEVIDFTKQMVRIKTGETIERSTGKPYIMSELREPQSVVKYNAA